MTQRPRSEWAGKRVLITGVCGTVGHEILNQLVREGPAEILGIDNNESELFFLGQECQPDDVPVHFLVGDVRDASTMRRTMEDVDIVLHAAALKHVHLCEQSPREAVHTNILGMQNIVDAAEAEGVERVLFTSSDKAVNPTSVMGTSKLMGERLFTAADSRRREARPVFVSTRFGNVLGSRGSVIPLFRRQIENGGPVTLTDPTMTRFIMTLQEAVALVMDSVFLAVGGEVFVTKMPTVRIEDLAQVMIEELAPVYGHCPEDIELRTVGTKPGEKLYEELLNEEEVRRTLELPLYFVIRPAVAPLYNERTSGYADMVIGPVSQAYSSSRQTPLSREDLRTYLYRSGLLGAPDSTGIGAAVPTSSDRGSFC